MRVALQGADFIAALLRLRALRRALSGRAWIALVAFALIGIVTLQLGLLKLNGGIGRALEHAALLQRENAILAIENSEMAAGDRVQRTAAKLGMQPLVPDAVRFLVVHPGRDARRAAAALKSSELGALTAAQQRAGASSEQGERSLPASQSSAEASSSGVGEAPSLTQPTVPEQTQANATAPADSNPTSAAEASPSSPATPSATSPAEATPTGGTGPEAGASR
jgi:cobalamin biosynthesis Mg chelatase CobN